MVDLNKINKMIISGELMIKYVNLDTTFTGNIIRSNEQILILLNNNLSYEYNLRKLIHELKHIEHLGKNKDIYTCEKESKRTEENPVELLQLVNFINQKEHMFV